MRRGLNQALDEYLVLLSQAGSREAFGRLAARWSPRLLAFAARGVGSTEAAHDAVQDTWESAFKNIKRLDDPARFRAWIYAIASRKCADALRARYRGKRANDAAYEHAALSEVRADPGADVEARLDLGEALKRLPPEQRVAIALLYGEDMSVAEIAAATGVAPGTVKSRLFAARQTLRARMEGELT